MKSWQEQGPAPADLALETVREWTLWLTEVERWLMPHFARREARRHAWAYIRGLLSPVERKNGWQLAEVNGDATPYPYSDTYMNMLSNTKVYGRVKNRYPLLLATANPRFYMCKFCQTTQVTL